MGLLYDYQKCCTRPSQIKNSTLSWNVQVDCQQNSMIDLECGKKGDESFNNTTLQN